MIGSGWLFGDYHAAKLAGPYSIISWIIGPIIIMFVALCFAELSPIFPRSGALVHMAHVTHGPGLGRIWSWLLFLAYVAVPAVESEAVITYANTYFPYLVQPHSNGLLSGWGFLAGVVLMLIFALTNLLTFRSVMRANTGITWWKIFVPLLAVIALLVATFHTQNFSAAPGSYSITGIFIALPTAGVVFSFFGFRNAIDLAGEASHPQRDIPLAVIVSICVAAVIYLLLQIAFLLALPASTLAHGWDHLSFANSAGPFAGLAMISGMTWLAVILYIDAYTSPGGTGLIYMTTGSRILTATGETGTGPRWLTRLSGNDIPWISVAIMWVVGCLFLLPFPAWQKMVDYITSITVMTFGLGPVVLLCLRRSLPELKRPFRLWAAWIIVPFAFICCNWIIYWVGFSTNLFLFSLIFAGFAVYALYYHFVARLPASEFGWRYIAWLLPWLAVCGYCPGLVG
jgi:amino acid transporter